MIILILFQMIAFNVFIKCIYIMLFGVILDIYYSSHYLGLCNTLTGNSTLASSILDPISNHVKFNISNNGKIHIIWFFYLKLYLNNGKSNSQWFGS